MARAADALQQDREASRRADVADNIDVADVDAELQRGGRDDHGILTGLELFLDFETGFARQTAVMGADLALP